MATKGPINKFDAILRSTGVDRKKMYDALPTADKEEFQTLLTLLKAKQEQQRIQQRAEELKRQEALLRSQDQQVVSDSSKTFASKLK